MKHRTTLLFMSFLLFFLAAFSSARASLFGDQTHVSADLFVVDNSPEDGLLAAVYMKIEPGWHVYWQNPGEAGMPVEIRWQLPEGFRSLPLEYPVPERFESDGITGYGYKQEVVLFSRIVPEEHRNDLSFPDDGFPLKAELTWLSCKGVCIPGSASLSLESHKAKPDRKVLAEKFWKKIPRSLEGRESLVLERIALVQDNDVGYLDISFSGSEAAGLKDFYPLQPEKGLDLKGITVSGRSVQIPLAGDTEPEKLKGVIVTNSGSYVVDGDVVLTEAAVSAPLVSGSLPLMLGLAFFGGVLLNIMPCVLPVLGLKVLSLIGPDSSATAQDRNTGRYLSLLFAAGVMFSFWVLAVFVWVLQGTGEQVGWGFQFQSPAFVMFIAMVVFAFSLNLFGLFEFGTPVVSGKVGEVAMHHDSLGAFVSGVLATTLATPCTAPFLGTALGFAFAQPSWVVFLFFTVIAIGMAAPYVVLAWHPAWLRFLPKPGHWMYIFKQLMGFVLVAVVVWLASILNRQSGGDGILKLLTLLLVVAFVFWFLGNWAGHGASFKRQLVAWGIGLVILGGSYFLLIPATETARGGKLADDGAGVSGTIDENGVLWHEFSPVLLDSLLEEKKTVFLQFTADWCITCKVLEASVLRNEAVGGALRHRDVAAVKADWTTRDDAVTTMLQQFKRSGVPLFVIIPRGDLDRAVVLPEVVTVDMLLSALEQARG